jgi:hypothetical protein
VFTFSFSSVCDDLNRRACRVTAHVPDVMGGGVRDLGVAAGSPAELGDHFHKVSARTPCHVESRTIRFFGESRDGTAFYQSTLYVPETGMRGEAVDFAQTCLDWIWWRATGEKLTRSAPVTQEPRLTRQPQPLRSPA